MYCVKCGSNLSTKYIKNEGDIPYCENCDELFFEKTNIAMIAILVNKFNEICLINQKDVSKYKVLIAGYLKVGETIEECVAREIKEEVGINVSNVTFLKSHYYENNKVLMMGFYANTLESDLVIDQDELDNASWYKLDDSLHRIREGSIAYQLVKQYINLSKGENNGSIN